MKSLYLPVAALAALTLSTGCTRPTTVSAKVPDNVVEELPDVNLLTVDHPERFPLVEPTERQIVEQLKVNGAIAPDVARTVPVLALSGGRVVEVHARLGDEVRKGQLLARIHSSDLAGAFSDYQKAIADEVLSRRQLERAQLLYSKGAMALKDLQASEDTEDKAKVDVQTTAERIRILGADPAHPSPLIDVYAPVSGTIVEQNIQAGGGVRSLDNSPNLFTIADLSTVWLLCDVYENNLAQVRLGETAEVRLNAYPDKPLRGRISNIGTILDPNTRAAKVRIELSNAAGWMRPNMFATATFLSPGTKKRLVVPAGAVMRLHDKDWVFRAERPGRFVRSEVQAGNTTDDGMREILGGISLGVRLAANALQFQTATETQ